MSHDPDCVFCKIALGEIPAAAVLTTDHVMAFLDVNPLADGHTLLIPKQHFVTLGEMDAQTVQRLVRHLPALINAVTGATGASGCNILQNNGRDAGQAVGHVHFHIIPRSAGDGLGYRWNAGSYPPGRADELKRRIEGALPGRNRED